jgi:hypothetical protein
MGAAFDDEFIKSAGNIVGVEGRALNNYGHAGPVDSRLLPVRTRAMPGVYSAMSCIGDRLMTANRLQMIVVSSTRVEQ